MNDNHTTTYSLLDEVVKAMSNYPTDDLQAVDKAWKELGVALTVLTINLEQDDVVDGVNKTFGVAKRLAKKINDLEAVVYG